MQVFSQVWLIIGQLYDKYICDFGHFYGHLKISLEPFKVL